MSVLASPRHGIYALERGAHHFASLAHEGVRVEHGHDDRAQGDALGEVLRFEGGDSLLKGSSIHPASLTRCAPCGKPVCGCPDAVFAGVMPGRRA
ncbi:MAG: hypothetical protein P0Y64_16675 [Candidatus Sphingomonas colombiensis]|nr:hypothetical protein [Sphingomonas sp.]WEK42954.1 MAG: hypothetical protein P0Y64_16675 [Sphingomonas sp.]